MTETQLRLRAATSMLVGYTGDYPNFYFQTKRDHSHILLEDSKGRRRTVYTESEDEEPESVTPEQLAFSIGESLYKDHPSFAADVVQDLQNKKDYYAKD